MQFPIARPDGLVVRELPDETLVYDLRANKAHCLNRAAALVWRLCDGRSGVAELAAALREELGVPDGEAAARLALRQLSRRGLLEQPAEPEPPEGRIGRREALRKLALLGALPIVLTVAARHASANGTTCQDNPCKAEGKRAGKGGFCDQSQSIPKTGLPCGKNGTCNALGFCEEPQNPTPTPTPPPVAKCGQECIPGSIGNGGCPNGCVCAQNSGNLGGTCKPAG
jgi:hypothetical protein